MAGNKDLTWMDIAKFLSAAARVVTRLTRWSWKIQNPMTIQEAQAYELTRARIEKLKIDSRLQEHKVNTESNRVVMTDARAELDRVQLEEKILSQRLKNLELQKKLEAAGVFSPTFDAANYADPGDVRRGKMYTSKDNNTFHPDGPDL